MKKILITATVAMVMAISLSTVSASTHGFKPKVACTCSPACSSGQSCCATANGSCGCFPFNCP